MLSPLILSTLLAACGKGTLPLDDTGGDGGGDADGGSGDGGVGDGGTDGGGSGDGGGADDGGGDGGGGDGGADGGGADGGGGDGGGDGTELSFVFERPPGPGALILTAVASTGGEELELGEVLAAVPLASGTRTSVVLGVPPERDLVQIDPVKYPGFRAAIYAPGAFADADADQVPDLGEPYIGAGLQWPVWFEAPIPEELDAYGVVPGWSTLVMDFDGGGDMPLLGDIDAIEMGLIEDQVSLDLAGTWDVAAPVDGVGLAVVPIAFFETGVAEDLLYEGPMADPWAFELVGPPPESHAVDVDGDDIPDLIELVMSFRDEDGDGRFDVADEALALPACHDGQVVVALWSPPPMDFLGALYAVTTGLPMGFVLVADAGGDGRLLDPAEALDLSISPDCILD